MEDGWIHEIANFGTTAAVFWLSSFCVVVGCPGACGSAYTRGVVHERDLCVCLDPLTYRVVGLSMFLLLMISWKPRLMLGTWLLSYLDDDLACHVYVQ